MIHPIQSTDQGHLKAGYLSKDSDYIPGGPFYVSSGFPTRAPLKPIFESMLAATKIWTQFADKDLWLCLSGGVDSECMALAFLYARIPFKVAICRFPLGLNQFDIQHAMAFCHKHGIEYRTFDLDLFDFYEQRQHVEYCRQYRCNSPQLTAHMHFLKMIPGPVVSPWCPPEVRIGSGGEIAIAMPTDRYFGFDRFFQSGEQQGVYFFFLHTPELIQSFLHLPIYQSAIRGGMTHSQSMTPDFQYRFKCAALKQAGFLFTPRAAKYTGFEHVKKYYEEKTGHHDQPIYEELFRYELEAMFPDPQEVVVGLPPNFLDPHSQTRPS